MNREEILRQALKEVEDAVVSLGVANVGDKWAGDEPSLAFHDGKLWMYVGGAGFSVLQDPDNYGDAITLLPSFYRQLMVWVESDNSTMALAKVTGAIAADIRALKNGTESTDPTEFLIRLADECKIRMDQHKKDADLYGTLKPDHNEVVNARREEVRNMLNIRSADYCHIYSEICHHMAIRGLKMPSSDDPG